MQALREESFIVVDGRRHSPEIPKKVESVSDEIYRRMQRVRGEEAEVKKRKLEDSVKAEKKTKKAR